MRNTKLSLFIVFCLFGSITRLVAQLRVDKIDSDKEAVKFVKQYFDGDNSHDWRSFTLTDDKEWEGLYNINQNLKDSLTQNASFQRWALADYNQDGKLDLIVGGKMGTGGRISFVLFLFLSNQNGDYTVKNIVTQTQENYPIYFQRTTIPKSSIPALRLISWAPNANKVNMDVPYSVDTVAIVADEYIVNYNSAPDSAVVSTVDCNIINVDGSREQIHIYNLDGEQNAYFTLTTFKGSDSTNIRGKITPDIYTTLLVFINYAGFKELPSSFASNTPELGNIIVTKVTYGDSSVKEIDDNSGEGTYTLGSLYSWIGWLVNYSHDAHNIRAFEMKRQNLNR